MPAPKGVDVEKYDRCVQKVKSKGKVDSPWAICATSLKQTESKDNQGIKINKWFWDSAPKSKAPANPLSKKSAQAKVAKATGKDAESQVQSMLVKNPEMNAATFLNLLKSQGLSIIDIKPNDKDDGEDTSEADAASSNIASTRGGVNTPVKKKSESNGLKFRATKFIEATARDNKQNGFVFKTVLLQEGMGNLRDAYWYSLEALESSIPVFEGKKIYADHPSVDDEDNRPERSVKDILGHFENVQVEEDEDGRHMLTADVVVLPEQHFDWARGLMKHSLEYSEKYPDKEFVGLSINASGASEPTSIKDFISENDLPRTTLTKLMKAMEEGVEEINIVKSIENAVSVDLVTEPGAGGKILKLIEEEKMSKGKTKEAAKKTIKKSLTEAEDEVKKADGEDGGDEGHDDEGKDKELIKSMIKKHLGDKSDGSDEEEAMFKQAMEGYGEMGYGEEEACEAAGHALKLSKHMADKQEAADADKDDEDKKQAEGEDKKSEADDKDKEEREAAMESEIIALKADVARMRENEAKKDLAEHVEKICRESGLPQSVTKVFKEHLADKKTKVKTIESADLAWKLFNDTYKAAGGEAGRYVISTEKQFTEVDSKVSLADCKLD